MMARCSRNFSFGPLVNAKLKAPGHERYVRIALPEILRFCFPCTPNPSLEAPFGQCLRSPVSEQSSPAVPLLAQSPFRFQGERRFQFPDDPIRNYQVIGEKDVMAQESDAKSKRSKSKNGASPFFKLHTLPPHLVIFKDLILTVNV